MQLETGLIAANGVLLLSAGIVLDIAGATRLNILVKSKGDKLIRVCVKEEVENN